jgi:Holliday junction DNA helicase RuvA
MISRLEGRLVSLDGGLAHVNCGVLTYALFVPAADRQRLSAMIDEPVTFFTLHYLEAQGQGSSFVPRLIGFANEEDRAFFEVFTTVKGMGNRKALRALALPFHAVAEAIVERDVDLLRSLPEIGKRTAETIVAELDGKIDRFIEVKPRRAAGAAAPDAGPASELARDAVAMLAQLGEPRLNARRLVERVLEVDPTIDSPEDLVAAAFRLRETS